MFKVSFLEAVKFTEHPSWWMKPVEVASDYFNLSGRKVLVVESAPKAFGVVLIKEQPFHKTILKILSYVAAFYSLYALTVKREAFDLKKGVSLAIPVVALAVKILFRCVNQLYFVNKADVEFFGQGKLQVSPLPQAGKDKELEIPFEKFFTMTSEEIVKLQIKLPLVAAIQELGLRYPRVHRGKSSLPQFKDSIFEVEWMAWYDEKSNKMQDCHFRVIRRKDPIEPITDFGLAMSLTLDEVAALKLVLMRGSNPPVYQSIREEYINKVFEVRLETGGGTYSVSAVT